MAEIVWRSLPLRSHELSLGRVLRCGQTFRWKNINNVWSFATKDRIILLRQDDDTLHYAHVLSKGVSDASGDAVTRAFINDYFHLDVGLEELYKGWVAADKAFGRPGGPFLSFPGIRMLRQDPWETVVLFICSSNNNVKRISKMCDSLCTQFGAYVGEYDGEKFYSFPSPETLAQPNVEELLRLLGFGYRARYIHQTAMRFADEEDTEVTIPKLEALRDADYDTAHAFLLELTGVGPKVADCICLMALDKHDIAPVDTHVHQIAVRDYKYRGKARQTLTKNDHPLIRQHFRDIFGPYAGWAQLVLFAADLSDLNNGVNIVEVKTEVKSEKAEIKHEEVEIKSEIALETTQIKLEASEGVPMIKREVKNEFETVKKISLGSKVLESGEKGQKMAAKGAIRDSTNLPHVRTGKRTLPQKDVSKRVRMASKA